MGSKCKPKFTKCWISTAIPLSLLVAGSIAMITLSAIYKDSDYNSLVCDIYDVSPVESGVNRLGSAYWYFQYSFSGQNCDNVNYYKVDDYNYYDLLDAHDKISNRTNSTCYARKREDQCDCSMNIPSSVLWAPLLIGSILLGGAVCALGITFCFLFEQ